MSYDGKIPFDPRDGSLQSWPTAVWGPDNKRLETEWRDNYEFEAVLRLDGFTRGRSAANLRLLDIDGREYTMFLSDFVDCLKKYGMPFAGEFRHGQDGGSTWDPRWTFAKKGQNYGVRMIG